MITASMSLSSYNFLRVAVHLRLRVSRRIVSLNGALGSSGVHVADSGQIRVLAAYEIPHVRGAAATHTYNRDIHFFAGGPGSGRQSGCQCGNHFKQRDLELESP